MEDVWGVLFLVRGAGRDDLCLDDDPSLAAAALRTSVMDVLADP